MSKYLKLANGKILCTTGSKLIDITGDLQPIEPFKYADTYQVHPLYLGNIEYTGACQDYENFGEYYNGEYERFSSNNTLMCKIRVWDLLTKTVYSSFIDIITHNENNTCFTNSSLLRNDFVAGAFLGTSSTGDLPIAVTVQGVDSTLLDSTTWSDWFRDYLGIEIDAAYISISINEMDYLSASTLLFFTYSNADGLLHVNIHGLRLDSGTTIVDLEFLSLGSNLGDAALNKNNSEWKNLFNSLDNTNYVTKINYTTDTDYNNFNTGLSASQQEFPIQSRNIQKIYGPAFAFRDYSSITSSDWNSYFISLIGCYYTIEPTDWANLDSGMCINIGVDDRKLFSTTAFTGAIWSSAEAFKLSTNFTMAAAKTFTFENNSTPGAEFWDKAHRSNKVFFTIEPAAMFKYYDYPINGTTATENQIQNPISKDFVYSMFNGNSDHSECTEELLFGGNTSTEGQCEFIKTNEESSYNSPYELKSDYTPDRTPHGNFQDATITFNFEVSNTLAMNIGDSGFFVSDSCNVYDRNSIRSYTNVDTSFTIPECQSRFISFPLAPLWKLSDGSANIANFQSIAITITNGNTFSDTERASIFLRHVRSTLTSDHPTYDELYLLGNNYEAIQSGNNNFSVTFDASHEVFNNIMNEGDNVERDSIVIWLGAPSDADLDDFHYTNLEIAVTTT